MQQILTIRTNNDRGQAFLAALRHLMAADPRHPNQTDVIMELVFAAEAKLPKKSRK
ncbi:MAG: hypothetical protein ACRCS9_14005 [Hyphomicrobium sp.]